MCSEYYVRSLNAYDRFSKVIQKFKQLMGIEIVLLLLANVFSYCDISNLFVPEKQLIACNCKLSIIVLFCFLLENCSVEIGRIIFN